MTKQSWRDLSEIESPLLAPWRIIDCTDFWSSENLKLKGNSVTGAELEAAGGDTKSLFGNEATDPSGSIEATVRFIVEQCDELVDHEEQFGPSKFLPIYNDIGQSVVSGAFEARKMLSYDEEYLITLRFSEGRVEFLMEDNEDFDWDEDEEEGWD